MGKKIKNFKELSDPTSLLKTKDELDEMSSEEIKEYKTFIIHEIHGYNGKLKRTDGKYRRYVDELELYQLDRFPEETYDMYYRWMDLYKKDPIENKDYKIIVKVLSGQGGDDLLYFTGMAGQFKKIENRFDFIKGVDIQIPDKYMKMVDLH